MAVCSTRTWGDSVKSRCLSKGLSRSICTLILVALFANRRSAMSECGGGGGGALFAPRDVCKASEPVPRFYERKKSDAEKKRFQQGGGKKGGRLIELFRGRIESFVSLLASFELLNVFYCFIYLFIYFTKIKGPMPNTLNMYGRGLHL